MSFPHLHVASGYSLRYGASTPAALVGAAAAQGMDTLALTDRDGLYGAVKFALACRAAGIAPVLGVDLAVEPSGLLTGLPAWAVPAPVPAPGAAGRPALAGERRTPVRGGSTVDPRHPRVTVLALGADPVAGVPAGGGWSRLCRLVSDTHLRGERGRPVATLESVAAHARLTADPTDPAAPADPPLRRIPPLRPPWSCCSGPTPRSAAPSWPAAPTSPAPSSPAGRPHCRRAVSPSRWSATTAPRAGPASVGHAARMLALAREAGVPAVLTNAVRLRDACRRRATADVLDAARRLVAARRAPPRPRQRAGVPGRPRPDEHRRRRGRPRRRRPPAGRRRLLAPPRPSPPAAGSTPAPTSASAPSTCPRTTSSAWAGRGRERPCCASAARRRSTGALPGAPASGLRPSSSRLDDELATIARLGYAVLLPHRRQRSAT